MYMYMYKQGHAFTTVLPSASGLFSPVMGITFTSVVEVHVPSKKKKSMHIMHHIIMCMYMYLPRTHTFNMGVEGVDMRLVHVHTCTHVPLAEGIA